MNGIAPFACSFLQQKRSLIGNGERENLTSGMLCGLCHAGECGFDIGSFVAEKKSRWPLDIWRAFF